MGREYERRVFDTEFEVRSTAGGGKTIVGYAAKYNRYSQDLGGFVEVVRPGFFDRVMGHPEILGRYNHTAVLGRTGAGSLRLSSDETGLVYEIDVNAKDPEAVSVLAKVERGDVHRSSFAFTVTADGDRWGETEQGFPLRELVTAARLVDVAPVDTPAYLDTEASVRALSSFAQRNDIDLGVIKAAAESGELITLIRGAGVVADAETEVPAPADRSTAAAPAVSVRLELERLASRRRARSRPR